MHEKIVLDEGGIRRALVRIAHEIVERTEGRDVAIVGIRRRGAVIAARIHELLELLAQHEIPLAHIDISPWRDDADRGTSGEPRGEEHELPFDVDERTIILVDDVLFTGRTIRAAIEGVFEHGRPARVQLAVLADRGHRELPIRPDYVGKNLPTARSERVNVRVREVDGEDAVLIAASAEAEVVR